jgi:dihydrolipoamide dehydrogenase
LVESVFFEGALMADENYDLVVIGSGPGGYVAAIRAAQLKMKVAIIEREDLGGVCLNWGCIPSKSLLKSAELYQDIQNLKPHGITVGEIGHDFSKVVGRSRKVANVNSKGVEFLMKKNKIDTIYGHASFTSPDELEVEAQDGKKQSVKAKNFIIATGARSREISKFPIDGKTVLGYRDAIVQKEQPESVVVIGGGAIGCEFAYVWASFGTKVTLIEMAPRLLPLEDPESSTVLEQELKKLKIEVITGAGVEDVKKSKGKLEVSYKDGEGKIHKKTVDQTLVSIGVQPNTEKLGLEKAKVKLSDKGFIQIEKGSYQTSQKNIFAIGDVVGPPMLAHKASLEGIHCVEKLAGKEIPNIDYSLIPRATYCQPQVASVGFTEEEAKKKGYDVKIGKFPFQASGKARAIGHTVGHVKVVIDRKYGELLGTHIVGNDATEMIAEGTLAQRLESTADFVTKTSHAHPTLSEAYLEAMEAALGHAVHI